MKKHAFHSRAFFLEIVMNLLLFTICAAICLQLFAMAYTRNADSRVLAEASLKAQTLAEVFKLESGRIESIARRSGGGVSENEILIFYDKDWNAASESEALYKLSCDINQNVEIITADIRVLKGEKEIFSITAMVTG